MIETIAARPSAELLEYLHKRRSVPIKDMAEPGPDAAQIADILRAAGRVPDHGKLNPWYFVVISGQARSDAGALLETLWRRREPEAAPEKLKLERERFLRAPLVIAVISRIRESKNPVWEQILSAGAACQNLCLAANALGFGANWVTEWYAYDEGFRTDLGLDRRDHVAGFIYIGTPRQPPTERDRPDLSALVTFWEPGISPQKGEHYGQNGMGFPAPGFDFSGLPGVQSGSKTGT